VQNAHDFNPLDALIATADRVLSLLAMAQLIVRNLPPEIVDRLKRRAAEHSRSAEAEHRDILVQTLLGDDRSSLKDLLGRMPDVGRDEDFERRPAKRRKVAL
jgi:plasmid stability protein